MHVASLVIGLHMGVAFLAVGAAQVVNDPGCTREPLEVQSSLRYRFREAGEFSFSVEAVETAGNNYSVCLFDTRGYRCQHGLPLGAQWAMKVRKGWSITVYRTQVGQEHASDEHGRIVGASETFIQRPENMKEWSGDVLEWRQDGFYLRIRVDRK